MPDGANTNKTPSALPTYDGRNMAPLARLEELKNKVRTPKKHKICDTFEQLYTDYCEQDEEPRRDAIDMGKMIANLTAGKVKMLRHPITNRYAFIKSNSASFADNRTVGGIFQFYRTKLIAEWLGSKPERDPICPSDDDRIEETVSAVKIVQDYYNRKFYTDRFETEEAHSAQEFGTYIHRYWYDEATKDIAHKLLPFPACIYDVRFMAEESQFFIYEQKFATKLLSKFVGEDVEIDDDGNETQSYGLQVIEEITRQGGGADGMGKDRDGGGSNSVKGETVVTEMWLQPECYCDLETDEAEETVSGVRIPANKKLIELFPNGLVVIGINKMKTIIGLYAENHKDHIVSGVYHLQSFSGIGKGLSDTIDTKKEIDDLHSQAMSYIKARGMPAYGYNQDIVTEDAARDFAKGKRNIPLDFKNAPEGVNSINQAIQAIQPQNPAQGVFEYSKMLDNWLQLAFQVTNYADVPGVRSDTAEGDRIHQSIAQITLVPQHRYKADMRCRADKIVYNLFRKYCNKPQFFAVKDLNGISKGKYLSGGDFADIEIEFQVIADSEVPKTPYSKEESLTKLLEKTGGVAGLMEGAAVNPEMMGKIGNIYGASDLGIAKTDSIARVCRRRIEQAKKVTEAAMATREMIQSVTGMPVEMAMAVEIVTEQPVTGKWTQAVVNTFHPPITQKEPYHQQKVMWIAELLDVDEMMNAQREVRDVLSEMMTRHIQMETLNGIEIGQATNIQNLMAELPNILAEQLMNQQQIGQQQDQMLQQQQMEAQKTEADNMRTQDADAVSHQRQMELSSQNQNQALQLEAMKQLGAMNAPKPQASAK